MITHLVNQNLKQDKVIHDQKNFLGGGKNVRNEECDDFTGSSRKHKQRAARPEYVLETSFRLSEQDSLYLKCF